MLAPLKAVEVTVRVSRDFLWLSVNANDFSVVRSLDRRRKGVLLCVSSLQLKRQILQNS